MTYWVRTTPRYRDHLREAAAWYEENASPEIARRFLDQAERGAESLSSFPLAHRWDDDLAARFVGVGGFPWLIWYRVDDRVVTLVGLTHTRMGPHSIMLRVAGG